MKTILNLNILMVHWKTQKQKVPIPIILKSQGIQEHVYEILKKGREAF